MWYLNFQRERERERETHLSPITGYKFVQVEGDNLANITLCGLDYPWNSLEEQNHQTKPLSKWLAGLSMYMYIVYNNLLESIS